MLKQNPHTSWNVLATVAATINGKCM